MTAEQALQIITALDQTNQLLTSIYSMLSAVVCVILPLMGIVWLLSKIFRPFMEH